MSYHCGQFRVLMYSSQTQTSGHLIIWWPLKSLLSRSGLGKFDCMDIQGSFWNLWVGLMKWKLVEFIICIVLTAWVKLWIACIQNRKHPKLVYLFIFYYRNTNNCKLWKYDMNFILLKRMDERNRYMNLNAIYFSSSHIWKRG